MVLLRNTIKIKNKGISYSNIEKLFAMAGWSKQIPVAPLNSKITQNIISVQKQAYQYDVEAQNVARIAQEELKTYKGIRYTKRLPVRGQRTHTNAQTAKKTNANNK